MNPKNKKSKKKQPKAGVSRNLTPKSLLGKVAVIKTAKTVRNQRRGGTEAAHATVSKPQAHKKLQRHGQTQVVAFVRDPYCLFTFWEVSPESVEAVKRQLMDQFENSFMVLMVFRTGSGGRPELFSEIKVYPGEMNRYLELKEPDGEYFVEVGIKTSSGRYIVYARSKKITLAAKPGSSNPPAIDSKWETPSELFDYFSSLESKCNFPRGISSAENHGKKLNRYSASFFGDRLKS